jgi:hypothetical protein
MPSIVPCAYSSTATTIVNSRADSILLIPST